MASESLHLSDANVEGVADAFRRIGRGIDGGIGGGIGAAAEEGRGGRCAAAVGGGGSGTEGSRTEIREPGAVDGAV